MYTHNKAFPKLAWPPAPGLNLACCNMKCNDMICQTCEYPKHRCCIPRPEPGLRGARARAPGDLCAHLRGRPYLYG